MHKAILYPLLGILIIFSLPTKAQLFSSGGLDQSFCRTRAVRQTVVYIDDMIMVDGRTDWAQKLVGKLKASLSPGERTTVVRLSPADGRSTEIWSGCWPAFTSEQKVEIAKHAPYIIQKNPLDGVAEQQGFFARDFVAAVSKIYFESKRPLNEVAYTPNKAPKKEIIRAIASDEGRFSNSQVTLRAVIYSDMVENSDLGSVLQPAPQTPINYAEKLGTHLRKSVFYAFGVGGDVNEGRSVQEAAKLYWTRALQSMSASVGGFGADLNVTNGIPVKSWLYSLTLKEGDQDLDGKASILTDADGNIVDSWLGFSRLDISGLKGTFHCDEDTCTLDGTTTGHLITSDNDAEAVILRGKSDQLTGQIGVKGTKIMLPLTATRQNNQ
jgi:hypothetical protein